MFFTGGKSISTVGTSSIYSALDREKVDYEGTEYKSINVYYIVINPMHCLLFSTSTILSLLDSQ